MNEAGRRFQWGIVKSANQLICRQNAYAAHTAATRAASAAQAFTRPIRCSSPTIVSILFGTLISDPKARNQPLRVKPGGRAICVDLAHFFALSPIPYF